MFLSQCQGGTKMEEKKKNNMPGKQELKLDQIDEVVGGAQVEVINKVENNDAPVDIGETVVIDM